MLALSLTAPSFSNSYRGDSNLPSMASAVATTAARQGRRVAIVLDDPGSPDADWSDVVALLIAASRAGYQPCVANPKWNFMMTNQYICTPEEVRDRWRIGVYQTHGPHSTGHGVVYRDRTTVVYGY